MPVERQLKYTILYLEVGTRGPCGYEDRALILVVHAGLMYTPCKCRGRRTQSQSILSAQCREPRSLTSLTVTPIRRYRLLPVYFSMHLVRIDRI